MAETSDDNGRLIEEFRANNGRVRSTVGRATNPAWHRYLMAAQHEISW
jgi:hypothetical protein